MRGLLKQKLCKGLGLRSCLGMRSKGSSTFQLSRDKSQLPWHPDPRGKVSEGKGFCVSPVQARGTLDSRLLVDAGEGGCSVPVASRVSPSPLSSRAPLGGIILAAGTVLGFWGNRRLARLLALARSVPGPRDVHRARRRRAPWGLAWPGPAHLPGLRPAPRSARGHLAGDCAPLVVTAAHRSGRVGPGWPLRGREAAARGGAAWSCGEPRAGGGRAHSDSVGDQL